MIMSYGTAQTFKSKKALKDAVSEQGAENVYVFDTSAFDNKGTVSIASLAGSTAVIVGPDVYSKRDWFANVKTVKGEIRVV
jgi:DeoR/GlpR family transcriptional regulator of sugar metabolism